MDRFAGYNPKVTFLFFLMIFILNVLIFNPIMLLISLCGALAYKFKLKGKRAFKFIGVILPLILAVALFNFLFSHFGGTVLFSFGETHFTAESLFYGFAQGTMLSGVVAWFSNYAEVLTAERFLAVFGKLMPNTALVFSMVLSFFPRLKKNAEEISQSRYLIDADKSKLKKSVGVMSALFTLTLEESVQTADSMRARGFGRGRSVYSRYKFRLTDGALTLICIILFSAVLYFRVTGETQFLFDPYIETAGAGFFVYAVFFLLAFMPCIVDLTEDIRWFFLKRKI